MKGRWTDIPIGGNIYSIIELGMEFVTQFAEGHLWKGSGTVW